MKAILDVDGTLWDFHNPLIKNLHYHFPRMPTKLPTEWDWFKEYMTNEEFSNVVFDTHVEQVGYIAFPGADLLLKILNEKNIEVIIASNRDNALIYRLAKWLSTNKIGPIDGIYAGRDKHFLIGRGDLVIDDNPNTIKYASSIVAGSLCLKWPWNACVSDLPYVARFDGLYDMAKWIDENVPTSL